jgi:ribonuclease BN (tRNA processing enzyme)
MLDIGHGSLSRLMQVLDFRSLTALVITHFHPDHYSDVYALRHAVAGAIRDKSRQGPLTLLMPSEPAANFTEISGYGDAFAVKAIDSLSPDSYSGTGNWQLGGLKLRFMPTVHKKPCYAVRIEGLTQFVYTGDTAYSSELVDFFRGADLLLSEASGFDSDTSILSGSHMTARQAGELGRLAGAKKLMITHFWPEYEQADLLTQAQESFGSKVELAREGRTYKI